MASSTETENSILEPSSTAEEIETETTPEAENKTAKSRTLKSTNKTSSVVKGFKAGGATSKGGGNKKQKKSKSKKKLGKSSQMNLRFKQQKQQNGADKPKSVVSTLVQQPPALVVASPSKRVEDVLPGNGLFLKFLKHVENSL